MMAGATTKELLLEGADERQREREGCGRRVDNSEWTIEERDGQHGLDKGRWLTYPNLAAAGSCTSTRTRSVDL